MTTFVLGLVFLLMIAAPCAIAIRSSRRYADGEEVEWETAPAKGDPLAILTSAPRRKVPIEEMVSEAETKALVAQEVAHRSHWAALAASARLAALKADAAAQAAETAGRMADKAIRAAEGEDYLPESHPSLDFPRSRVKRHAA